jgi:hypothetical protein
VALRYEERLHENSLAPSVVRIEIRISTDVREALRLRSGAHSVEWEELVRPMTAKAAVRENPFATGPLNYIAFACFSAMSPMTGNLNIWP